MLICSSSHVKTSDNHSEKGKLYLKYLLIIPLATWNLKLSKPLTILFSLVRILTKDFSADSLNLHPKLTQREEPASSLAWLKLLLKQALSSCNYSLRRTCFYLQPKIHQPCPKGKTATPPVSMQICVVCSVTFTGKHVIPLTKRWRFPIILRHIFKRSKQWTKEVF